MRITSAEPEKHDAERVAIFVDEAFAFGCHVLVWLESGLHIGDEVTEAELAVLRQTEGVRAVQERALRLLAGRPRGRTELARHLAHGTKAHPAPPSEYIHAALDHLAEQGLLDDRAFAEFWVEQRDRFRPKGSQALRAELRGRGVGKEEVDAAIAPERDLERAIEAGRRKAAQLTSKPGCDARLFRDQIGPFLQRRGFGYGVARAAVAALWEEFGGRSGEALGEDDTEA